MYYPRLPASTIPMTYCADDLVCPRVIERYNPTFTTQHFPGIAKARSHRSVCGPSGWRTTANLFLKAIGFTVETQRDITQWRSLRVAKIHQETTRQRSTQSSYQICADAPLGGTKT